MPSFLLCMLVLDAFSFHWPHLPSSPPSGVAPWAMFTDPVGVHPAGRLPDHALGGRPEPIHAWHRPRGPGPGLRAHRQGQGLQRVAVRCSATPSATRSGPIITILGLSIPALLGGALIIESVFNYAGLGIQTVNAATNLDIPTVLGITLLVAILTLLGNLLADVALGLVNPRIRIEGNDDDDRPSRRSARPTPTDDLGRRTGPADGRLTANLDDEIVPMWKQRLRIFVAQQAGHRVGPLPGHHHRRPASSCPAAPDQPDEPGAHLRHAAGTPHRPWHHWLGTDSSGFDELGRIFYGGEYSLTLGFLAGFITIVVGTLYGMISGFVGGVTDTIMMRIIDAFLSIPYIFLLITLITIFGRSTVFLICIIGFTLWWGNARIIRGDALLIRQLEYSQAATAMGGGKWHIIRRHVFPNSISNIVTVATFSVADAILFLSALGFLGLGIQAPQTDWGTMLQAGHVADPERLLVGDLSRWPSVFILVVVSINYIGDALRDAFEVRLLER